MTLSEQDNPSLKELADADDARIAATITGDKDALGRIFSDDLHYAHATGVVDDKASLIARVASGTTKYLGITYVRRDFTFPAAGIALMSGHVRIRSENPPKEPSDDMISFLAVWERAADGWRFRAWQASRLPAA